MSSQSGMTDAAKARVDSFSDPAGRQRSRARLDVRHGIVPLNESGTQLNRCRSSSRVDRSIEAASSFRTGSAIWGLSFRGVAAGKRPTEEDGRRAKVLLLSALARGDDPMDVARELSPLHPKNDTFPGELFLSMAVDVIDIGSFTREDPLDYENLSARLLPELELRGRARLIRRRLETAPNVVAPAPAEGAFWYAPRGSNPEPTD